MNKLRTNALPILSALVIICAILGITHTISYLASLLLIIACVIASALISARRGQKKLCKWELLIQGVALVYILLALMISLYANISGLGASG